MLMSDVAKKNKQRIEKQDFGNYDIWSVVLLLLGTVCMFARLQQPHSSSANLLTHRKGKLERIFL